MNNNIKVESGRSTKYVSGSKSVKWFIHEYLNDNNRQVLFIEGAVRGGERMFIDDNIRHISSHFLTKPVKDFEYCFNPKAKKTWLLLNV